MDELNWLPESERKFYASTVHGLRSQGWSRQDAEDEALSRLEILRQRNLTTNKRTPV